MAGIMVARKARAAVRFYLPVMSVIFLASLLAFFATLSQTQVEAAVFTAEEESGTVGAVGSGIGNTLLFILPAVLGSFGIVAVIKMGRRKLLKSIFRGALSFTTGVILAFFMFKVGETLSERVWYIMWAPDMPVEVLVTIPFTDEAMLGFLIFGLLFGYATTSMIFSKGFNRRQRNGSLIMISALMGAFMSVILPTWTVVFLLIGLAIWDIYAVFKGPIRDMVEMDLNGNLMARWDPLGDDSDNFPFENMTYDAGSWQLGIGDLVFYSMLGAHSIFYSTSFIQEEGWYMLPFFFVPVVIAILAGFTYTIYRLTRGDNEGLLPGLPIPMFLGVGVFLIMMAAARWVL